LPSYAVREAGCCADWILMALLHHASGEALRETAGLTIGELEDDGNPWTITISQTCGMQGQEAGVAELQRTAEPQLQILEHLRRVAAFRYPHQNRTTIPTKLAVSAVAKGAVDMEYRFSARPKFLGEVKLTGAERGNAMHRFMQFSDYDLARDNLAGEIARMQDRGFLSRAEAESLNRMRLRKFFAGSLARRIFASKKVLRELKFTAECGRDILGDIIEGIDEEAAVVLQGVADCVFFEEEGAVIVDYKTDWTETREELARRYENQLRLYRIILSRSLDAPVKQCLLYSFHFGCEIEVL